MYIEDFTKSRNIRKEQYEMYVNYIDTILGAAENKRKEYFIPDFCGVDEYIGSIRNYRNDFCNIIGYPPPHKEIDKSYSEEFIAEDEICKIYRLCIKVAEGLECYGILMIPNTNIKNKYPIILAFHGGSGCPELICNFGQTDNYNDAARKFVKSGFAVFAPGFLFRSYVDGENSPIPYPFPRLVLDTRAKWAGTNLAAIDAFRVIKAMDVILEREEIEGDNVAVAGLSYGGFFSLLVAALDERIKGCISSGYFNERLLINKKHPERLFDWTWKNSINKFSDVELVAMICPRMCIIEAGINDDLHPIEGVRKEITKAKEIYKKLGLENNFRYIKFGGTHEFELEHSLKVLKALF